MTTISYLASDLSKVAKRLLADFKDISVWIFKAQMGAGKTTLIKEICMQLGVVDAMSSPTFSIVNEYLSGSGSVYHFDFYRVDSMDEALDIGVEDYFFSGSYCLIEWPDVVETLLPERYVEIHINLEGQVRHLNARLNE